MPSLLFKTKTTNGFPSLAALKFLLGNRTAVSILTPTDAIRKTVTVEIPEQTWPIRVSPRVQVNGITRNVKIFWLGFDPQAAQKIHAMCDYVAWCDVAVQPVQELSQREKRYLEVPVVRIVAPRPPAQPPAPPARVALPAHIPLPPQLGAPDPPPDLQHDTQAAVSRLLRERAWTALFRLTDPSWEDAQLVCRAVEHQLLVEEEQVLAEHLSAEDHYAAMVNDAVKRFQQAQLVPSTSWSVDFLMRTKKRTTFAEPSFSAYSGVDERKRRLEDLAWALRDDKLAWEVEKRCDPPRLWKDALAGVRRGQPLPHALERLPRDIVARMKAALAPEVASAPAAADEGEVEVTGERSWAERDRELRARAVVLE